MAHFQVKARKRGWSFLNVKKIAWGLGRYLIESDRDNSQPKKVLVAHDTRFMGDTFAKLIINILNEQGIILGIKVD